MAHALRDRQPGLILSQRFGDHFQRGFVEPPCTARLVSEQRFNLLPQGLIATTGGGQVIGPLRRLKLQRGAVEAADFFVPFRRHPASLSNSRNSHERASLQSLRTVRDETFKTAPISSSVSPPKKRNSTTWL